MGPSSLVLSGAFILDDVAGARPGDELKTAITNYGYHKRVLGDLLTLKGSERDPIYWATKACQKGTLPRLYLSCGTEDDLFPNNVAMRKQLCDLVVHQVRN